MTKSISRKPRRFAIMPDVHGDEADPVAVAAALAFTKAFNPDVRVINGDLWNFAAIRNGADANDRAASMREDFEAGRDFADAFFKGGRENHLMLGNHDVRPWDMLGATDAVRRELGLKMIADIEYVARRNRATLWPYDARGGVLQLGHLSVVHGFHTGASAAASHARIYGNVVYGHVHGIESYQTPGLRQKEARAIGCLCKLDQGYINRKTAKLRWAHGWAYGWLFHDDTYQIHQARSIEGKFYASTEIQAY